MICPFCHTVNRDDQDACYHCNKDLSMLRLIVNKSKHHYNLALEHAERARYQEAIAELENALDLDKSNINARVVLGTIYARLKQFDKARDQWELALGEDQRLQKAHNYLIKGREFKRALPLFKWLSMAAAFLLVVLCVVVYLTIKAYTPDKNFLLLNRAWDRYNQGNYSEALNYLGQVSGDAKDLPVEMSLILSSSINKEIEATVASIKRLTEQDNYLASIQAIEKLIVKNPPHQVEDTLNLLREDIKNSVIKKIDTLLSSYEGGEIGFDEVKNRAQEFAQLFPKDRDFHNQLSEELNNAKYHLLETALADLQKLREEGQEPALIIARANEWLQKLAHPEQQKKITDFIENIKKEAIGRLLAAADEAVKARDINQAKALIDKVLILNPPSPSVREALQQLNEQIAKIEKENFLKQFDEAYTKGLYEEVVKLAAAMENYDLNNGESDSIEEKLSRARVNLALKHYNWMEARDSQFEQGHINEEEARTTVRNYQFILDYLPQKGYGGVFHQVLFYAGSAYLKLDQIDKAKELFSTLEQRYPWSPYIFKARSLLGDYQKAQ